MKPESKKLSEKRQIQNNDDANSSFDLSSIKEAIEKVPKTKKTNPFDLTSMSLAISSVDRQCSKRRLTAMKRESMRQRFQTLVLICKRTQKERLGKD
ncbi:unnamed protein product [Arabis nemorensis]|uniref:Uncharacterized protein n=1 Tax=Arabis nemorensis TaxID=586526 RepID=A0A565BDM2_9BRAS|nr:unnamed protein product [Arabis nemorensis]